jgi:predicted GNAT family N-acyltransferase
MPLAIEELDPKRHDRAGFDCGVDVLNRYLRNLAAQHRAKGVATTFVLVELAQPGQVLGYYALSAATVELQALSDSDRKGLPDYPIPAVRIGRLAGSLAARGRGVGELLLQNAVKRALLARSTLGVHAVVVEAKDATAAKFYRKYGFRASSTDTRQLYLPLGAG